MLMSKEERIKETITAIYGVRPGTYKNYSFQEMLRDIHALHSRDSCATMSVPSVYVLAEFIDDLLENLDESIRNETHPS